MNTSSSRPTPPPPVDEDRLDALVVNLARHGLDEHNSDLRAKITTLLDRADQVANFDADERRALALAIRRLCYLGNLPEVLALSGVPSVYNFAEDYLKNRPAPWDRIPDRDGVTRGRRWSLMGFEVGYPVGIPASVLTANAKWIDYYARNGFNVITYKTVRSRHKDALVFPNWVYLRDLDAPVPVEQGMPDQVEGDRETFFADPTAFSTANSFGVPSDEPELWMRDVRRTLDSLKDGKLLIVSVMGTPEESRPDAEDALADDYAKVAGLAVQAGAPAVELNLSCPNTLAASGENIPPVCENHELTARIVHRVADELDRRGAGTRLVCKMSWMRQDALAALLPSFVERIHGLSGINTMAVRVVDRKAKPTFGSRAVAGVSGIAIREFGLDFVRSAAALRAEHGWDVAIIGMGGVMGADDVRALLDAGADAVQTATAASHNPTLPLELTRQPEGALSPTAQALLAVMSRDRRRTDLFKLASDTHLAISTVRAGLFELERRHLVVEDADTPDRPGYALHEGTRATPATA